MIFKKLCNQISVILEHDPAARSVLEVVFCYPGFHAMVFYSFSNYAWRHGLKWLGRFISHLGRVFDHGMGVVIGATTEIGDDVTLYQGVTLGGTSLKRGVKRHPTLQDGVIVGAGAKVLGPIIVGKNARIGSNAVVVADVEAGTTVVGVPAKAIRAKTQIEKGSFLAYGTADNITDPSSRTIDMALKRIKALETKINDLENKINSELAEEKSNINKDQKKD